MNLQKILLICNVILNLVQNLLTVTSNNLICHIKLFNFTQDKLY